MPNIRKFQCREVVWCAFEDEPNSRKPEFIGKHLCVILSTHNRYNWPLLVVPLTSQKQDVADKTAFRLSKNPIHYTDHESWVVCSHIYSVSFDRLERPYKWSKKINQSDYEKIKHCCCRRLPFVPEAIPNKK